MIEILKNYLQNGDVTDYTTYVEENEVVFTATVKDKDSYLGYRHINVNLTEILEYLWKNTKK